MEVIGAGMLALASDTGTVFKMDAAPTRFSEPLIKNEDTASKWAPWGTNNLQGKEMAERIEHCGVLNAAIEAKARIAIGMGLRPVIITGISKTGQEELEFVDDPDINEWLEQNSTFHNTLTSIRNLLGWGWSHDRFILSNDGKTIARWKTDEVVKCRIQRINTDSGRIEKTGISADWSLVSGNEESNKYVKEIRLLEEHDEISDLTEILATNKDGVKEFSMITRGNLNANFYYPNPLWWSARDWVDMDIKVPGMKLAMMINQMTIKYIITIHEDYFKQGDDEWESYTAVQKQEKFLAKSRELNDHLAGNDKAYKSITTMGFTDPRTNLVNKYISIDVIDDKTKDGKLLVDTGAANKEILFALMINPAVVGANTFGGDMSGGAGSGSDIREAYLTQIMLMEAERQREARKMTIIKRVNGWDAKFPGKNLQFRYPNLILTTLDTGGSTAPVVPGASQKPTPDKTQQNATV